MESGFFPGVDAERLLLNIVNEANGVPVRLLREHPDQVAQRARRVRNVLTVAQREDNSTIWN